MHTKVYAQDWICSLLRIGFKSRSLEGSSRQSHRVSCRSPAMSANLATILVLVVFAALCAYVEGFQLNSMLRAHIPRKVSLFVGAEYNSEATLKAMEAARNCAASGLSPGAGLATAEEQAEV